MITRANPGINPYPIALFRIAFFFGLCIHFFPSLFDLRDNFSKQAFRTCSWNSWLFEHLPNSPPWAISTMAGITILACLMGLIGYRTRLAALLSAIGLYIFSSFNSFQIQTLGLVSVWAILPVWIALGGGAQVLSLEPSVCRKTRPPQTSQTPQTPQSPHDPRYLPALILFQILFTVFFSGIEKLLVGWPFTNEMHHILSYPAGFVARDWIVNTNWANSVLLGHILSWLTVIIEITTPLLFFFRKTRLPALVVYEGFFLIILAMLEVPPLFYFIFAFGGLLVLSFNSDLKKRETLNNHPPRGSQRIFFKYEIFFRYGVLPLWIGLDVLGALNHTLFPRFLGRHLDLYWPHLKYGHVMFARNPESVSVYSYIRPTGGPPVNLAELEPTPAIGYKRSRFAVNMASHPEYLSFLCQKVMKNEKSLLTSELPSHDLTFIVTTFAQTHLVQTTFYTCSNKGLLKNSGT